VASEDQLRDLADAIVQQAPAEARVFSDEIYEKILFEGARHHSIASLPGMAERTIIVSGASKSYSWTGGRIGWAAYPTEEEAQLAKNLNINYFSCTAAYNQEGARVGIESPLTAAAIAKMNQAFEERRDVVVAGLNGIPGVRCQKPLGAFYVFPNIAGVCESLGAVSAYRALPEAVRLKTSPSTLFQMFLLFRYQVATMDRKSFGKVGSEGLHFLRLSIATGLADLKEAVARIGRAAGDRDGFAKFVAEGKRLA
jgi:aspartate/methionine/tyrosine aminotransferase